MVHVLVFVVFSLCSPFYFDHGVLVLIALFEGNC